jgi:predicted permease
MVDALRQDVRYAVRSLAQRPLVSAVAVLSLALGIGANTAIFSMFNGLLLRSLPVPAPSEIVNVLSPGPKPGSRSASRAGRNEAIFSYPLFRDLETASKGTFQLAAHREFAASVAYRGQTSQAEGLLVSGGYFAALRVAPAVGRLLDAGDDLTPGAHPFVVLTHTYWTSRFGADRSVIGSTLVLNGEPMSIVGVAPPGFWGTTTGERPDLFVPLTMARRAFPNIERDSPTSRNDHWLYLFARLPAGGTREQAEARINVPFAALLRDVEFPALRSGMGDRDRAAFVQRRIVLEDGARGRDAIRGELRTLALFLFAVAGLVLAIACANVANLLLARGAARSAEVSVRMALGASKRALIRLLLVEAGLLGLLGAAGALVTARLTLSGLLATMPAEEAARLTLDIDSTVLAFTLVLGVAVSLLTGLVPAMQLVSAAGTAVLHAKESLVVGSRGARRFRTSLATGQIAAATALLALAGLFALSLVNLGRAELGIRREGLVSFKLSPELNGYAPERARALFDRVETELRGLPDVTSVTAATIPILADDAWFNNMTVEGVASNPDDESDAAVTRTSTDYFRTLGVQVLAGREFDAADAKGAPRVAIVNEAFARKFKLEQPIGRRMAMGRGKTEFDIEIVGLVRDLKYNSVRAAMPAQFFLPYRQEDAGSLTFYVRTAADTRAALGAVNSVVHRLDGNLPVMNLRTMDDQIWNNTSGARTISTLAAAFAGLAIVLAAIGLYGVIAYTVAQRVHEIGIRMALGATARQVHGLVLGAAARMTVVGTAIGCAAAFGVARLGQAMFFGGDGMDPRVLAATVAAMAAVALGASAVPSRRAAAVNPVNALRAE